MEASVESDLVVECFCLLACGHDHLVEDGLLLLQVGDLLLEAGIFLFLVDHTQLQRPVERLHQGASRI